VCNNYFTLYYSSICWNYRNQNASLPIFWRYAAVYEFVKLIHWQLWLSTGLIQSSKFLTKLHCCLFLVHIKSTQDRASFIYRKSFMSFCQHVNSGRHVYPVGSLKQSSPLYKDLFLRYWPRIYQELLDRVITGRQFIFSENKKRIIVSALCFKKVWYKHSAFFF
jgi:hypothetical protein